MPPEENGVVTEGSSIAPAPAPAAEPVDTGDEVNWSDMALESEDDGGDVGTVEGDTEVVESSENESQPPSEPLSQPATPAEPAPATPPVTPQPEAAAPPQTPPQTPSQEPPAQPAQAYQEWRGKQLEALEKHYAFSEDSATKMLTEPELVIPKLAAQLHMEVTEHVMRSVYQAMPNWMRQVNDATSNESKAEEFFFSHNPDLKNPSYKPAIFQMFQAYRQVNPTAAPEEAVKMVGNMVRTAMGLSPAAPSAPGVPAPATPAPAAPAPFTPARGGGGGAMPAPTSSNPWSQMAEDFLKEPD